MAATAPISVKLYYKDDVRRTRIAANASYVDVAAAVEQAFGAAGDLTWKDEDGDHVNVKTDADWAEAVSANPKLVKLFYTPAQQPQPQPQPQPVPVEIEEEDDTPTTPDNLKMPEGSEFILAELATEAPEQASNASTQATDADADADAATKEDGGATTNVEADGGADAQHQEQHQEDRARKCQAAREAAAVASPEFAKAREAVLNKPAVHHGIECDASGQNPIVGTRYHLIHYNYDVNEAEFNKLSAEQQALFEAIARPGAERVPVSATTVPIIKDMIKGHKAARAERRRQQREQEAKETQHPHYAFIPAGDVIPPFRAAFGSVGPGVVQLQHALIAVGAMSPDVISYRAGFFGPGTTKAIRAYKTDEGIESRAYQHGTYDEAVYDSLIEKIDALVNGSDSSDDGQRQQPAPESTEAKETAACEDDADYVVVDTAETASADGAEVAPTTGTSSSTSAAAVDGEDSGAGGYANAGITEGEQWEAELKGLADMGFVDTDENRRLLALHHGALPFVIAGLV